MCVYFTKTAYLLLEVMVFFALTERIICYWWTGDVNSNACKELDFLISTAGYTQSIDKPIHFFSGASYRTDLVFCRKHEIVSECGIVHSLFQTCHHNLIFAKISGNMSLPQSCSKEVLGFQQKKFNKSAS